MKILELDWISPSFVLIPVNFANKSRNLWELGQNVGDRGKNLRAGADIMGLDIHKRQTTNKAKRAIPLFFCKKKCFFLVRCSRMVK